MYKISTVFFTYRAKQKGFTLFETVIYIGLLSLLMMSTLLTVWQLLEASYHDSRRIVVHEEGNFVLHKITTLLADAQSVSRPGPQHSSSTVLVLRSKEADVVTVRFNSANSSVEIRRKNTFLFVPLTTENVAVRALYFTYLAPSTGVSAGVRITLDIDAEVFEAEMYIR